MDARTSSRTAASRRPGLLARAGMGCALALPLAYGGTLWLQILHTVEGGREQGEPGLLTHWLRDGTLALPGVLVAVVLAAHLIGRVVARAGLSPQAPPARAALAASAALASAVVFAVGSPIHGHAFHAHHGGHEMSFLVHALRDGTLSLVATLLLATITVAVPAAFWRALVPRPVRGVGLKPIAQTALVLAVVAPVGVTMAEGVQSASAGPSAGQPCPTGSPVKRFTVQAVDVDIPLNRFGDHDPSGKMYALTEDLPAIRAQEQSQKVSIGLRDDPIQPLVIRANLGDCVEIDFSNNASGGEFGMHIDGLSFEAASSGDAIGRNTASSVVAGATRTYRYYVPKDPELEGTHYIRPGPGNRTAVSHGLFGALSVEPAGSVYLHPDTRAPLRSGWEAIIAPEGKASFREYVKVYHEIGDEKAPIMGGNGTPLPTVDPITDSYRPGSRGINYRSEPFMHRLQKANDMKSLSYNSYTFGDPATPMMRAYVSDPTKIRIMHAGSEMFHVYHLHGGGIRWPQNPFADKSFDYANVGLDKHPHAAATNRLDSQSFGPGESYTLQIEGGAGGVQRAVGDLLEHCHIAEHYVSGMWSFWRVFNTRQPDLAPLPDRTAPPTPVDSAGLIGRTMADGTTLTKDNLGDWLVDLLPPKGKPQSAIDGSVWDWSIDASDPQRPVYLGEPEDTSSWPNLPRTMPGHPSGLPGDRFVNGRPVLLFNPVDGRPAYPLLRPHVGQRSPQTPNGHSGTPFLGGRADAAPTHPADAWANRPDGLCPAGSTPRTFNVTTIQLPIQVTSKGATDPTGKIFVLSKDKPAVRAGDKPAEPLAIRANIGDCVSLTLTSEFEQATPGGPLPRSNLHIHHVQFDPQGSDGASAGMVYDQSVLPYRLVDPKLTAAANAGDTVLHLADVAKFQNGVPVAVGEGTDGIEVRKITAIDSAAGTVTLDRPLKNDHPVGEWAGTEFTQLRWYPDVELDNVFWHDHVDGIHGWGKGLVGQLIVEPKGSTYHDPRTGAEVDSGTIVDIHTPSALAPGLVDGSFRELALWTIDDNPVTDSTLNLRASPWADRLADDPDPSLLFSSWRHGDPNTPLPRAYRGDPFVLRSINISGNGLDSLRLSGHRFYTESRYRDAQGKVESTPTDSIQYGISQRFTAILEGGAGGTGRRSGDFLYHNGIGRRFRQGAWGLLRVMPSLRDDLQALPGTSVPAGGASTPAPTGGRPPVAATAGNPCPAGAPARTFEVSAVDMPRTAEGGDSVLSAFVPTADAAAVARGTLRPEPLALHAAAGECVTVKFTNNRSPEPGGGPRASFHVAKVAQTVESSGVNAGFNPEQTVEPGATRTSRFFMDSDRIGSATIADFGGNDTGTRGLYGALVVAPAGATFSDPTTGKPRDVGTRVDVTLPGGKGFRDFTLAFAENDPRIGANTMPYPTAVAGPALVNYRTSPRPDDAAAFSSQAHGDPTTPVLQAYAGDPVKVHVIGAPGSEQPHSLSLGGQNWYVDPLIHGGNMVSAASFMAWSGIDAELVGGAGGMGAAAGDFWYGDLRRPFAQAGMWGLMRVLPWQTCTIKPLAGLPCGADRPAPAGTPVTGPAPTPAATTGTPGTTQQPTSTTPSMTDDSSGKGSDGSGDGQSSKQPGGRGSGKPEDSGASNRPAAALRDLVLPRRISLAAFRRGGLEFWVTTPADTRSLEVRLVDRHKRTVLRGVLTLHKGGTENVLWRLSARDRRKLRAGQYRFVIRGGVSAARLGSTELGRALDVSDAGR